jgi:hypothetical protein
MKTKHIFLGIAVLFVAGTAWYVRLAWRAHLQIVTLDVHNAPLAVVLDNIERQTWKPITTDRRLDARITLHVINMPLVKVLDRIAEQAGAHWSTVYAVYKSKPALKALDSALQGDGKIEPNGWTKIAPNPPEMDGPGPDTPGLIRQLGPRPDGSGPPGQPGQKRMMMMIRRAGNGGAIVTQGGDGTVEVWSPEELVIESPLATQLGSEHNDEATPAWAADTARKVQGRWTTLFSLRKSSMGVGFGGVPGRSGGDPMKHSQTDRFARLTPEQRVQRARARQRMVTEDETITTPKALTQEKDSQ